MQNNFKKIPFAISIVIFAFLLVAFIFLYRQISSNNQKAELSTSELENEISRRAEIRSLNRSIETIKEDRALLETHFAKSSDIVPFLDTIESLAPKVGAKAEVTSVNILEGNIGLVVQISASGSFKSVYKFLTLLENSPYELEFVVVDMQTDNGQVASLENIKVSEPKWQAVFKIKLLSFVQ